MPKESFKPRMSDEAVESKTGKNWSRWSTYHYTKNAKKITHKEIAAHLSEKDDVRPWWTQMITVTYEQARGLREVHEKPEGYEISVRRTIEVPVAKAFKAWTDEKTRKKWLTSNFSIRKATANKSLRITWEDGKTSVAAAFTGKGPDKCQVVAQHSKLPNSKAAAKMKKFWGEALDRLKDSVE